MPDSFSLDISYNAQADRLHLNVREGSAAQGFLLTRRLTKRFLESFADLLERSAVATDHGPRAAVIFEHLDALNPVSQGGGGTPADKAEKPRPQSWAVVTSLNIRLAAQHFEMTITDEHGNERKIQINRPEAHRVLNAIYRKTQVAEWDLEKHLGWLRDVGAAGPHAQGSASLTH